MRIILELPSDEAPYEMGVCAYDIIGLEHNPAPSDPYLILTLASGERIFLTWEGKDTGGILNQIVEALLSPSGVADCRNHAAWDKITVEFFAPKVEVINELLPVTIEDEVVPVTVQDQCLQVSIANEPIHVVNMF